MFSVTMHPRTIGHRSRILVLRKLIEYIQAKGGAWFATHREAAERAESAGEPQIVSFLCHTYAMKADKLRRQCGDILSYMTRASGTPVTATEAKHIYDRSH